MSELNTNGFFEPLQKERDTKEAKRILAESKQREDSWWNLYRKGLVKYDKNTLVPTHAKIEEMAGYTGHLN